MSGSPQNVTPHSRSWQRVMAALANPDQRTLFAQLVCGAGTDGSGALPPARRARAAAALVAAGLISENEDGELQARPQVFSEVLASAAPVRREGIKRYLEGPRILSYPKTPETRKELLEWVARHAFEDDEELSESAVNERLSPFSRDTATLRRHLVDHGLLGRSVTGERYSLIR